MKAKLVVLGLSTILGACGGGSGSAVVGAPAELVNTESVSIEFEAVAANQTVVCDQTLANLGVDSNNATVRDFRFYVHDVYLITDQGDQLSLSLEQTPWQYDNVALLDFENQVGDCSGTGTQEMNFQVNGSFQANGDAITGVGFKVGVPESLNHNNPAAAPSPLNLTSMHWSWQGGYKFMRLDVAPASGSLVSWNIHLGSKDCVGDPASGDTVSCSLPNRPAVELMGFDPQQNKIRVDYAALMQNSNLSQDQGGAPGCMSGATDPECNEIFSALGLNINTGLSELSQNLFTVVQ